MFTTFERIYVAKDGKKFLSEEECAKYEKENFLTHRYIVTLGASFTAVFEIDAATKEEAEKEAHRAFEVDYDSDMYDDVDVVDIRCDDDEED